MEGESGFKTVTRESILQNKTVALVMGETTQHHHSMRTASSALFAHMIKG